MQPQYRDVLIKTRSHSVENAVINEQSANHACVSWHFANERIEPIGEIAVLIKLSKIKIDRVLEYKYSYTVYFYFLDF